MAAMTFDSTQGLDYAESKAGPEAYYYQCNECLKGIVGMRRFHNKALPAEDYDLCENCALRLKVNEADYDIFPPGWVDLEAVRRSAPFPVDLVLSLGKNARGILEFELESSSSSSSEDDDDDEDNNDEDNNQNNDNIEKNNNNNQKKNDNNNNNNNDDDNNNTKDADGSSGSRSYSIQLIDVVTQVPDFRAQIRLDEEEARFAFKAFHQRLPSPGDDLVAGLLGKTVLSRFMRSADVVAELVLAGRHGVNHAPCRHAVEQLLVAAFRRLSAPDLSALHPLLVQDYFMSLFSANFDYPDPFSQAWFARIDAALAGHGASIRPCDAELFSEQPNDLQMVLAQVTSAEKPAQRLLVVISPASNGLRTELQSI